MLHIVKSQAALNEFNAVYAQGDQVVLIEEAAYLSNAQHPLFSILKTKEVFVLLADVQARGMQNRVSPSIQSIDYLQLVDLTASHSQSLTWN